MVLDREEQDIRKKMCEGDWISQVGPMVHATEGWEGLQMGAQREQAWPGCRGTRTAPRQRGRWRQED